MAFEDFINEFGGISVFIIILVVSLLVFLIALKVGIKAVKGDNTNLGQIFITWLILIVVGLLEFIPFVGFILAIIVSLIVIMKRHNTTFLGALGAVIIAVIFIVVVIIVLLLAFGVSLSALSSLSGI